MVMRSPLTPRPSYACHIKGQPAHGHPEVHVHTRPARPHADGVIQFVYSQSGPGTSGHNPPTPHIPTDPHTHCATCTAVHAHARAMACPITRLCSAPLVLLSPSFTLCTDPNALVTPPHLPGAASHKSSQHALTRDVMRLHGASSAAAQRHIRLPATVPSRSTPSLRARPRRPAYRVD